MDGQSIAVTLLVVAAIAILLRRMIPSRNQTTGCGSACSGCSLSGRSQTPGLTFVTLGSQAGGPETDRSSPGKNLAVDRNRSQNPVDQGAGDKTHTSP
jgi:hypothetical protein